MPNDASVVAVVDGLKILDCHALTEATDYLLHVAVTNFAHYLRFALYILLKLDGVPSIKSSFALQEVKTFF